MESRYLAKGVKLDESVVKLEPNKFYFKHSTQHYGEQGLHIFYDFY